MDYCRSLCRHIIWKGRCDSIRSLYCNNSSPCPCTCSHTSDHRSLYAAYLGADLFSSIQSPLPSVQKGRGKSTYGHPVRVLFGLPAPFVSTLVGGKELGVNNFGPLLFVFISVDRTL